MVIKTIDEMEKIVSSYKSLSWDGWTVVKTSRSNKARTLSSGVRIGNQWYVQDRFVPGSTGWEIPENILKDE